MLAPGRISFDALRRNIPFPWTGNLIAFVLCAYTERLLDVSEWLLLIYALGQVGPRLHGQRMACLGGIDSDPSFCGTHFPGYRFWLLEKCFHSMVRVGAHTAHQQESGTSIDGPSGSRSGTRKKNQKVEFRSDIQEEKLESGLSMYFMQIIRRFYGFASFS